MAIVELNKITLYGAVSRKASVIDRLQDLGCVHLVSLAESRDDTSESLSSTDAHQALRYLDSCAKRRRQVRRIKKFNYREVVAETLALANGERDLGDERDELNKAIAELEPWGDFQLPEKGEIGGLRLWFYVLPLLAMEKFAAGAQPDADGDGPAWREASHDHQNAYVVVLSHEEPENVPGKLVKLDPRSLTQLRGRREKVEEQLDELHHRRIGLTRWREQLSEVLDEADDAAARQNAALQTLDRDRVFALQAWAPRDSVDRIRRFTEENGLACTIEPPTEEDEPPTFLENPEWVAGSEALVTFYKTPAYRAWDPSLVTYGSFAIFFAMILADAGYGLVIGLLVAWYWKHMGQSRNGRRFRNVLATIVVCAVGYGVLCGSYFGFEPAPDSFLGRVRILDAASQQVMMPLTMILGVIHLSLAHLVMAWLNAGRAIALGSLGWVAVMIGATAGGVGATANLDQAMAGTLTHVGAGLLIGGLVAVFLFSSERPLLSFSPKNHLLRILDGLQALTGVSGLFGDVLSYLRLFALGLSSAKLAATFNSLAQDAWNNAGFGVIGAIGILLLGHTLNLLLGIMSGVVHGLRLNCIEFFKWSLPNEGYLFSTFAKKGKEI